MPPSGRKGKTRARRAPATEGQEPSDAETPEAIATPSRGSKKRARGNDQPAPASRNTRRKVKDTRATDREDTEGTEAKEPSDAETEPALPTEADIIAHLKVADRHVNATEDFANDLLVGQENVPGYGKIAGRDWAFIIRKVEINIGRPEVHERLPVDDGTQQSGPTARTIVDIDLGPDRQVSRSHAIISYDSDTQRWYVVVNGRNGLRLDNNLLKRGAKSYLRNGSVIEIANTQMAFITTPTEAGEEPEFDASIVRQAQKSSEDDDDGEDDLNSHNFRQPGLPSARSQLSNSAMYGEEQNGQQRRTHPHSHQAQLANPGTPMRTQQIFMNSSPMAHYARGVMMESTETIDYSADSAKDLKPPHSYAQMIGMAILSTPEQQMTLSNIYKWIMSNYAFFRYNTTGWQNSIRHNLSLNKAFTKVARRTDEPGKGMKWIIEPTEYDNFVSQGMKGCRRPNLIPATQSTLGSPHSPMHIVRQGMNGMVRQEDITPPMNAYPPAHPTANEAYTPDRGPKRQLDSSVGLGINGDNGQEYDFLPRSTPRNGLTAIANAAGSPPALFVQDDARLGPLETPFPLRPSQRLAPPSTLRRPSDYIQFSSPAPFWKMEGLAGSTPFKAPFDLSPMKTPFPAVGKKSEAEAKDDGDADETGNKSSGQDDDKISAEADGAAEKTKNSPIIQSSSPPRPVSANTHDASPTLSRPSTAMGRGMSQLLAAATQEAAVKETESSTDGNGLAQSKAFENTMTSAPVLAAPISTAPAPAPIKEAAMPRAGPINGHNGPSHHGGSYTYSSAPQTNGYHDDGEDEGIDLAKGFQSIGAFHQHQRNHLALGVGAGPAAGYGR